MKQITLEKSNTNLIVNRPESVSLREAEIKAKFTSLMQASGVVRFAKDRIAVLKQTENANGSLVERYMVGFNNIRS
jgi:hypothetical protein